jgi:uncharacterized protein (DUF1697 family)
MTSVAFLRAVNVAGHARVSMSDVVRTFEHAGCRDARSYGHAGNLLWTQSRGAAPVEKMRALLGQLLGEAPGIMVRTGRQIRSIVGTDPFGALVDDKSVKLYVVFLERRPKQVPALPLRHAPEQLDLIAIRGREAYVVSRRKPNGFYGFPNQLVERVLGVPATSRNWSTVVKVARLLSDLGGS